MKNENTYTETQMKIIGELYKTIQKLGGKSDILATIGSWGDCQTDEEVYDAVVFYNENC